MLPHPAQLSQTRTFERATLLSQQVHKYNARAQSGRTFHFARSVPAAVSWQNFCRNVTCNRNLLHTGTASQPTSRDADFSFSASARFMIESLDAQNDRARIELFRATP